MLRRTDARTGKAVLADERDLFIETEEARLEASAFLPMEPRGIIVFVHGSGSGRFSPRNRFVASRFSETGLAAVLMDLLSIREEAEDRFTGHLRFNIPFLARRVQDALAWVGRQENFRKLPAGLFGASTGAAAALQAAAGSDAVRAVVSRGGRPDLAGSFLPRVKSPVLLIVGALDEEVLELNRQALEKIGSSRKDLKIVPGAGHLFEEPGTLDQAADLAAEWFLRWLGS